MLAIFNFMVVFRSHNLSNQGHTDIKGFTVPSSTMQSAQQHQPWLLGLSIGNGKF